MSSGFSIDGLGILFLSTKPQKPNGTLKYCCLLLKIEGFENPSQKIDGFGQTRRTPSDDSIAVLKKLDFKLDFQN